MSRPQTLPDLEDLAAYIDGRLDDARRLEVEARLADDEDYYELFLETTRLQEDLAKEIPATNDGATRVVPIRRRRGLLAGLAAAAALALVVGWSLWESDPLAGLDADAVVAHPEFSDRGLKVLRGSSDTLESQHRAYALGVLAVDLELASTSSAAQAVSLMEDLTQQLEGSIDDVGFGRVQIRQALGDLTGCLKEDRIDDARSRVPPLIERLEDATQLLGYEADYLRGRWVETGRLAAIANDRELLSTSIMEIRARFTSVELEGHEMRIGNLERELETGLRATPEARVARLKVFQELHYDFS